MLKRNSNGELKATIGTGWGWRAGQRVEFLLRLPFVHSNCRRDGEMFCGWPGELFGNGQYISNTAHE